MKTQTTIEIFEKLDIRVGVIVNATHFEARKPAYKLSIDFGEEGIKTSTAQLVNNYTKEELIGKQVLCIINLPPRQVGAVKSEVLTLGVPDEKGNCNLITTDKISPIGGNLY